MRVLHAQVVSIRTQKTTIDIIGYRVLHADPKMISVMIQAVLGPIYPREDVDRLHCPQDVGR